MTTVELTLRAVVQRAGFYNQGGQFWTTGELVQPGRAILDYGRAGTTWASHSGLRVSWYNLGGPFWNGRFCTHTCAVWGVHASAVPDHLRCAAWDTANVDTETRIANTDKLNTKRDFYICVLQM